jgi:YHS domain-containing protein
VDYSIVSGTKFSESEKLIKHDYNGREILLLSDDEVETFKKDPKPYIARLDSAIMAAQLDSYPTDLCIVSGEKLGGMGKPVNYIYNNQLVRFCCEHCIDRFKKEPDKYMSLLSVNETESKETEEAKP